MSKLNHVEENRREERTPVKWVVQWNDGHRVRQGEVKDASPNGVFLSPTWKPTDPISPGDVIELRIEDTDSATEFEAVVCWVGESRRHHCEGLGLATKGESELAKLVGSRED